MAEIIFTDTGGITATGVVSAKGGIDVTEGKVVNFRPSSSAYAANLRYDTQGNEALVLAMKNNVTSLIVSSGDAGTTLTGSTTWQQQSPSIQVKNKSLYVNKLLGQNVTPDKNFYVEGDSQLNGKAYIGAAGAYISYNTESGAIEFNN